MHKVSIYLLKSLSYFFPSFYSVKDIGHDRISLSSYVYMTGINCTIETKNKTHAMEIRQKLEDVYGEDLKWQGDNDETDHSN